MTVVCVHLCRWLSATFPSMQLASICLKHPDRLLLSHLAGRGRKSWNAEYSDSYWGQSWNWDPRKKKHVLPQLWWWRGLSNGSWIISESLKTLKQVFLQENIGNWRKNSPLHLLLASFMTACLSNQCYIRNLQYGFVGKLCHMLKGRFFSNLEHVVGQAMQGCSARVRGVVE